MGGYGYSVAVMRRDDSPNYYLREGDRWDSLGHDDLAEALAEARRRSGAALAGRKRGQRLRLGPLFTLYETRVTPTKSKAQRAEDERRIEMWTHVLGKDFDPLKLTGTQLKAFERARREGKIKVPGRKLRKVGAETVRHDLAFLRAVFNWSASMASGWLLERNPMDGYELPREINPSRPRAYWEDYLELQKVARTVHPLFGAFMQLIEALGWRVTATCSVLPSDFDPERTKGRPHGRLLKRAETDKVGVRRWTILSADARAALEEALQVTGHVGSRPLFESSVKGKPWSRFYARKLLDKAWEEAKVPEERRVSFHAFRRKWVDERKHLPRADVAAQGAWLSTRTLDIYEHADEDTLRRVAEEPRKLQRGSET